MTQFYGLDQIGTVTNTGGTANVGGVLGDVANVSIAARLIALAGYVDGLETSVGTLVNTGEVPPTIGGILGDVANVSIAARLATLQSNLGVSYNNSRYLAVTADMTSATWNVFASTHEVFTVTGAVRLRTWIECTSDLTSGGAATVQFGIAGSTAGIIASTAFDSIDAGFWYSNAGTVALPTFANCVMDYVIRDGVDVGYEIGTADLTGGVLIFHCVWEPMDATGTVVAGVGGAL